MTQPTAQKQYKKKTWLLSGIFLSLIILGAAIFLLSRRPQSSIPLELEEKMTYQIINQYPHDPTAFTQGLIYLDGVLYESTGLYGQSSLRRVALETGAVQQQRKLEETYFAEGLTNWRSNLIQLTWQAQTGFIYDRSSFNQIGAFNYPTEGWGLTHDEQHLIMSDGTSTLYFLDPLTFATVRQVTVTYQGNDITQINELEFVLGEVYANIWQTDFIIRIDPETGSVVGWIDLQGLLPEEARQPETDVLNGIAYDPQKDRLFVTGKFWPFLYEIALLPAQ